MKNAELKSSRIERLLRTTCVGRVVHYRPTVGSTMDLARQLAEQGTPEGTLVLADEQTAGRGRLQRTWWAPAGTSLLMTLVLRPPLAPRQAQRLTMIASLAVCDAIAQTSGQRAQVKWPNDVLIQGRKVCGILTELSLLGDQLEYALIGIGLNVNVDLNGAPQLMAPATSLMVESGHPVSRLQLLIALLTDVDRRYSMLRGGHSFRDEWAESMATLGQQVQASNGAERWSGQAIGIDPDGALLIRLPDGSIRRLLAGDVTLQDGTH